MAANGTFFSQGGAPAFQLSNNLGKHFLSFAGFWLVGEHQGTVYGSMSRQGETSELWPGPLDTITGLPKEPSAWNKVWKVTSGDITSHKLQFKNSGYVTPSSIADWPARTTETNVNPVLAPFIDWDADGTYHPDQGDYPRVSGDDNLYIIANDGAGEHQSSGTQKLGIQILGSAYVVDHKSLEGVVFVRMYVINHSPRTYVPFSFGIYSAFQLGNPMDNRMGTHVANGMIYGFNGDDFDEGPGGFGQKMPLSGCVMLNQPLFASAAFNQRDSIRKHPSSAAEFKSVMAGNWQNGQPKKLGGNGTGSGAITRYIYSGNSDPQHASAQWEDNPDADTSGLRNALAIVRFDSLKSNGYQIIDFAFFARVQSTDRMGDLEQINQNIRGYYNKNVGVKTTSVGERFLKLYPNPVKAGSEISLEGLNEEAEMIKLFDSRGSEVPLEWQFFDDEDKISLRCNEALASGVYQLIITHKGLIYRKMIVITDRIE